MQPSHLTDATALLTDPHALNDLYDRDGCLLIRNTLDPATTTALAEQAAAVLHRWNMTDTGPRHGAIHWNGTPLGDHDIVDLDTIPALTTFIAERNTRPLRGVVDAVCGHPTYLWRNVRLFVTTPEDPITVTRPHRDGYTYSPTGDYRRLWIALTHIPFADNGLAVVPGSHHTERPRPGPPAEPDLDDAHWHTAEFHPGDALVMHSQLLHRGLPPTSTRIRIAMAVITSGYTDRRPPGAFTAPECRIRNQYMRTIATRLHLTEDQHTQARSDLNQAGQPVTEATVRQALTGEFAEWRSLSRRTVS